MSASSATLHRNLRESCATYNDPFRRNSAVSKCVVTRNCLSRSLVSLQQRSKLRRCAWQPSDLHGYRHAPYAQGFTPSDRPNLGAAFRFVASNCSVCVSVVFGWMSVWYSNAAIPADEHSLSVRPYGLPVQVTRVKAAEYTITSPYTHARSCLAFFLHSPFHSNYSDTSFLQP